MREPVSVFVQDASQVHLQINNNALAKAVFVQEAQVDTKYGKHDIKFRYTCQKLGIQVTR